MMVVRRTSELDVTQHNTRDKRDKREKAKTGARTIPKQEQVTRFIHPRPPSPSSSFSSSSSSSPSSSSPSSSRPPFLLSFLILLAHLHRAQPCRNPAASNTKTSKSFSKMTTRSSSLVSLDVPPSLQYQDGFLTFCFPISCTRTTSSRLGRRRHRPRQVRFEIKVPFRR